MPRRSRRIPVLALAAAVAAALLPVAPAAAAAPSIHVELLDPVMTDPAQVLVQVADAGGAATAFTGTVTLSVGRSTAASAVRGGPDGTVLVQLATAGLPAGSATMTARIRADGAARTLVLTRFLDVVPQLELTGFGCAALPASGGTVRWAVARMAGEPIRTPDSRDVPLLPYVASSLRRWSMTDADGLPVATAGTVVLQRAGRTVATTVLPRTVRKLVFGSRFRGGLAPGAYTARLQLRDPAGRIATAVQPVTVVARGAGPCSA